MTITPGARYHVTSAPGITFIAIGYDQNEDETVNPGLAWLHPEGSEAADIFPADELTPALDEITLSLTEFQASEVEHGLDIDAADHHDEPLWGRITPAGKYRYCLTVAGTQLARDRALYRITSSRDICLDNAATGYGRERMAYLSRGRSLEGLTARLIEVAGGPEAFSKDVRRWIRY